MLTSDSKVIKERFDAELMLFEPSPSRSLAPTQNIPVVIFDKTRILDSYRWGLVPGWAKDLSIGSKMINARSETLLDRPAYKTAFKRRRCLIPADGFYEWVKGIANPGPRLFELPDKELFAFAGLWESWASPQGDDIRTCTIITTAANKYVREVHDRMPAILSRSGENVWLNPASQPDDLLKLLRSSDTIALTATQVSKTLDKPAPQTQLLLDSF